jgi:ethanolamine utilization protein
MMEEIIRRVLEELKALEMNANTSKKMIVLSRNAASCETIRDRFKDTYEVVFVQNFTLEDRPDALLLKELTPEELVLLSEGKNGTLGPVLECLMEGKPVYLEETGLYHVRNRTTCPKALYSLYEKALKSLESYGVLVLKDEKRNRKLSLEKDQSGRILITESEVKKRMAAGEKVLYVSKRTMITPLAKDLMKENGIVAILQEGGEDHADR